MELGAFEGRWRLTRTIQDARAGRPGRFDGVAVFEPGSGGLWYREVGTLTLEGAAPMAASRGYLWRDGGAGTVAVLFEDGRFFHRFDPGAERPEAVHDCAPDTYRVRYDFRDWPAWRVDWRVTGPRKDYAMVSRYEREDGFHA